MYESSAEAFSQFDSTVRSSDPLVLILSSPLPPTQRPDQVGESIKNQGMHGRGRDTDLLVEDGTDIECEIIHLGDGDTIGGSRHPLPPSS